MCIDHTLLVFMVEKVKVLTPLCCLVAMRMTRCSLEFLWHNPWHYIPHVCIVDIVCPIKCIVLMMSRYSLLILDITHTICCIVLMKSRYSLLIFDIAHIICCIVLMMSRYSLLILDITHTICCIVLMILRCSLLIHDTLHVSCNVLTHVLIVLIQFFVGLW